MVYEILSWEMFFYRLWRLILKQENCGVVVRFINGCSPSFASQEVSEENFCLNRQ